MYRHTSINCIENHSYGVKNVVDNQYELLLLLLDLIFYFILVMLQRRIVRTFMEMKVNINFF